MDIKTYLIAWLTSDANGIAVSNDILVVNKTYEEARAVAVSISRRKGVCRNSVRMYER